MQRVPLTRWILRMANSIGKSNRGLDMKRFLIFLFLLFPLICTAAEKPLWVTAEGESVQGDMDTPKEVKQRAKRDAQTKAVESAVGTFVKSHTLVSNSQVAEDLVYAAVRGKIEKEQVLSSGWDPKDRSIYRVKIKALIKPVYPEKGGGLVARVSLSRTQLGEGDEVEIFYQVNSDCYVHIFSIAADGSVTLLFPNSNITDNFVSAGAAFTFPPRGGPIRLNAMFLPGFREKIAEERIKLIATRHRQDLLPLGFREGMFQVYDAGSTGMVSDLVRRLNQVDPTDWTEASATYVIRRKSR